jgi:hypothetical protein
MRAILTVICLLVATPALAGGDVGIVVIGEATMQPQLASQLEGWLKQHGHQVVVAPLPPDAINTLIDCFVIEDEGCAKTVVAKRAKTQAVVFAKVELAAGATAERTVTLTAYWFDKGGDAVAERRYCERCTDQTLRSTADELISALVGAGQKDIGHLKVSSTPAGARVVIDGKPVGITPLDVGLSTGNHKVVVNHPEHVEETRGVTISRGDLANLEVTLRPTPRPSKILPIGLIGLGAAAIVTGGVLIAIDEDPEDAGMETEFVYNTAGAGVGVMIGGLVVGGLGGYLLFRAGAQRESTPIAAITSDTAYIGWAGRF